MEGGGHPIARAARSFGEPRQGRTFLAFSRTERATLRRRAGVHCRTRLDRHHMVRATGRRSRPDGPHCHPRRMFLVLLFACARLVSSGNHNARSGFRLCALLRRAHLVSGTRLFGESFSRARWTMGLLSVGHRLPVLFPCLSVRQSLRAVIGFGLACRLVRAHDFALAVPSGRNVSPVCPALLPDGWRRRSASLPPGSEAAFLGHVSEHRGERTLLGSALRRLRTGGLRHLVS